MAFSVFSVLILFGCGLSALCHRNRSGELDVESPACDRSVDGIINKKIPGIVKRNFRTLVGMSLNCGRKIKQACSKPETQTRDHLLDPEDALNDGPDHILYPLRGCAGRIAWAGKTTPLAHKLHSDALQPSQYLFHQHLAVWRNLARI